jgi:hypothetical protein
LAQQDARTLTVYAGLGVESRGLIEFGADGSGIHGGNYRASAFVDTTTYGAELPSQKAGSTVGNKIMTLYRPA